MSTLGKVVVCGTLLLSSVVTFWTVSENRAQRQATARAVENYQVLQQQLRDTAAEAARCRQLLRQQTLEETVRAPDELLAMFPAHFPAGDWRPAETKFEDCWFESEDGLRLHGWLLPHSAPRATILLLHGNAGNVSHRARFVSEIHDRAAVAIFILDYRGYGRSEGTPTFDGLVGDARAARRTLAQRLNIGEKQIVLFGESLGGAVAVQMAAADGARGLVLDSTFSSLQDVAGVHYPPLLTRLVVSDKLNSAAAILNYRGPLLQFHGDQDVTVPYSQGRKLFDAAPEPKTFVRLAGLGHNDPRPGEFFDPLQKFLAELPP